MGDKSQHTVANIILLELNLSHTHCGCDWLSTPQLQNRPIVYVHDLDRGVAFIMSANLYKIINFGEKIKSS